MNQKKAIIIGNDQNQSLLENICKDHSNKLAIITQSFDADTNKIIQDSSVKIVFFHPEINKEEYFKIVSTFRKERKDLFLVAFNETNGLKKQEMYLEGLMLMKKASCNLVLSYDKALNHYMIITPEEAAYHESSDKVDCYTNLVEMAYLRSHLTFTRSTVIAGDAVDWNSDQVPAALREVVNHCIQSNAYKVFNGATVGHFASKIDNQTFLTSKRKTNFNDLNKIGLVKVKTDGPDTVIAYGSKPSVGGQSQRQIFADFPDTDCIVHFHCPLKKDAKDIVPLRSQRENECGSFSCAKQTASGLTKFGNLWAVMLDNHGPNIVFNKDINPQEVIDFIENNFELSGKTGGYIVEE